ncbi:MAG: hypothetical protein V3V49_02950 [Candidatus Krumholzibacteria bacterium]
MNSRAKILVFAVVVVSFISGYMVSSLVSAPAVALLVQADWNNAIIAGQVVPSISWDNGLESFYPGMMTQLRAANLSPEKDFDPFTPGQQNGMIMAWGSSLDDGTEVIGKYEYVFAVPEDLSNTLIDLIGLSPCLNNINTFGIGLRDATGKVMSWYWAIPANQPCDTQLSLSVNPGGAGPNIAATASYTDTGFDLAQVTAMTFHEKGLYDIAAPLDPAGFGQNTWNGWANLVLSATVPVEETTWGAIKERFKE